MKKYLSFIAILIVITILSGCVRTRVIITSNPSEADVTFKGEARGKTPVEIPINWYWFYDVKIEKEGYNTVEKMERFRTPPWLWIPFDLVCEIMPFMITDTRERHYELTAKEKI